MKRKNARTLIKIKSINFMVNIKEIKSETPWFCIEADDKDWKSLDKDFLNSMLEQLFLIRSFEEKLLELKNEVSVVK